MQVKITDMDTDFVYYVNDRYDCLCKTDQSGYDECVKFRDVITMGHSIFEPIFKAKELNK